MKFRKSVLALLLSVTMVFGLLQTPAFALSAKKYQDLPYKCYTYIGDSVPFGYGLVSKEISSHQIGYRTKGSYPDLVGKVLEANNDAGVYAAACSGARLCDFRTILERFNGADDPTPVKLDWFANRHPDRIQTLMATGPSICREVRKSDLVTVQLGINDITSSLVNAACATGVIDLNRIQAMDGAGDILDYLAYALGNLQDDPNVLGNFLATFGEELIGIRRNARAVVREMVRLAPEDTQILVIGYHKATKGMRVIPGTSYSFLFSLIDNVLMTFNTYLATTTLPYDNVTFVEASDADVFFPEGTTVAEALEDTDNLLLNLHPSAEGHRYIAEQILETLEENQ